MLMALDETSDSASCNSPSPASPPLSCNKHKQTYTYDSTQQSINPNHWGSAESTVFNQKMQCWFVICDPPITTYIFSALETCEGDKKINIISCPFFFYRQTRHVLRNVKKRRYILHIQAVKSI